MKQGEVESQFTGGGRFWYPILDFTFLSSTNMSVFKSFLDLPNSKSKILLDTYFGCELDFLYKGSRVRYINKQEMKSIISSANIFFYFFYFWTSPLRQNFRAST